jgi:uncharacterized protein YcsI (UPF0317 family)
MSKNSLTDEELLRLDPREFRSIVRSEEWKDITLHACRGYAQENLVIVPKAYALEFLLFCHRNPSSTALSDVTEPGDPHPRCLAQEADLRTDVPRYRIYREGLLVDEPMNIIKYWQDDLVGFLIGCSGGFDWSLSRANVRFRMTGAYTSTIQCVPAGPFHGPMVVTCRFVKGSHDAVRAVQISSRHPAFHGPPIHIGDPRQIGIEDIYKPDLFMPSVIADQESDEIPIFWGCGITPAVVAMTAKIPFMITHVPGHMFVTDRLIEELALL